MSDAGSLNERLIRPLLERVDRAAEQTLPAAHPEEETLVLFAQGTLDGPARAATVEHLAECVDCRKAVSLLLTLLSVGAGGDPLTPRAATRRVSRRTVIASLSVATAAGLLLALTLFHGPRGPGLAQQEKIRQQAVALLAANQYDQVSRLIAQAENQGAGSAGLKSLQSQAVRHMPDPLALACAGRLSDFGYGIDGVIARAPALAPGRGEARQAEQLLAAAGDSNVDVLLNRGHALLALRSAAAGPGRVPEGRRRRPRSTAGLARPGPGAFHARGLPGRRGRFSPLPAIGLAPCRRPNQPRHDVGRAGPVRPVAPLVEKPPSRAAGPRRA